MIESHLFESLFQGVHGTHGDSNPKDWDSKASMRMYRNHQFSIGVGLPNKILWLIHMNLWRKLRDKNAAKRELTSSLYLRPRSPTKQALALGIYGDKSYDSPEQIAFGVKQEPTEFELRLSWRTLETFIPAYREMESKIGSKLKPRVMSGIDMSSVNPKGCPLPVALLGMNS